MKWKIVMKIAAFADAVATFVSLIGAIMGNSCCLYIALFGGGFAVAMCLFFIGQKIYDKYETETTTFPAWQLLETLVKTQARITVDQRVYLNDDESAFDYRDVLELLNRGFLKEITAGIYNGRVKATYRLDVKGLRAYHLGKAFMNH